MTFLLIQSDSLHIPLADRSVQCVVCSPPYWGLRDYGIPGQLGLESTPEEYVAKMTQVFREVRRVLRDDGTCWVNLGDSYARQGGDGPGGGDRQLLHVEGKQLRNCSPPVGLKPKDLVGIPWRVAFALQGDGWYLRSDIIWHKPNPMPESVTDRPTKAHEYLFLLTKSTRYFYDAEAIKESSTERPSGNKERFLAETGRRSRLNTHMGSSVPYEPDGTGRNRRSVWTIPTQPYSEAHFATYPEKMVEPCILAGTSDKGCCPQCGTPWRRITTRKRVPTRPGSNGKATGASIHALSPYHKHHGLICGNRDPLRHVTATATTGWATECGCGHDPVPCLVLDPFNGSGTTGAVAVRLGRRYIGLDLSATYLVMAERRIGKAERPSTFRDDCDGYAPLFCADPAGREGETKGTR